MKTVFLRWGSSRCIIPAVVLFIIAIATSAQADQVDMQNGDRYSGKVVALGSNTVVLNSDVLGTLRIRRDKIASISFGTQPTPGTAPSATPKAPPVPVVSPSTGPNPQIDFNSSLSHHIAANPHLVSEVRSQVLAGAGPKALQKYDSIVGGLSTGTINIADLRKEASSVAGQLRQLRGSGDDESADIFDEYLAILDSFLAETKTAIPPAKPTNAAKPSAARTPNSSPPAATSKPIASPKLDSE